MYDRKAVSVRFFKKAWFGRFADREGIADTTLKELVNNIEENKGIAALGGSVFKVRMARTGEGKSGGYRVLLFYRRGDRIFYVYAFSKSERANISQRELQILKKEAGILLQLDASQLDTLVSIGELVEF